MDCIRRVWERWYVIIMWEKYKIIIKKEEEKKKEIKDMKKYKYNCQ